MVVFDVAVVVDDFLWNFGLEVLIGQSCFACDAVDSFDYSWSESVFVGFFDFVMKVVDFVDSKKNYSTTNYS